MRFAVLLLLLGGCTPAVISSTPAGGIVSKADWKPGQALDTANKECAKFGKVARVSAQPNLDGNMPYDCVAP